MKEQNIIQNAQAAFFVVTSAGDITLASRGLYAVPTAVFLERGIDAFDLVLAESERLRFAQMLTRVLESDKEVHGEIFQTNRYDSSGDPAFFSLNAKLLNGSTGQFLFELTDRTAFVHREREVKRLEREVLIFKEISYLRQHHTDTEQFFSQVVAKIVESTESDAALLFVEAEGHEELLVHNSVVERGKSISSFYLKLPHALHKGSRVSLYRNDTASAADRAVTGYVKRGWHTLLTVPLRVRDERVGTLILLSKLDDAFPWPAVRLSTSIASYLGAFLASELLWRQKERLTALTKSVFAYSSDGLFVIDRDGRVGERNALTERIIGTDDNVTLESLVQVRYARRVSQFTRQLRLNRTARVAVVFKLDPTHTFEISATPLSTGELVHYLCMARNVTGWVDERSALQQRNDKLSEVDRIKDEFVSMVSHELRSPLTVVMGNLSLLDKLIPAEQQPLLSDMRRNIDRLNRLVRDILEVTRLEYADITFESTSVELSAIVEVVESAVASEVKSRGIIWQTDYKSQTVQNDPVRLSQVVTNLVSNAVRHTGSGGTVALSMRVVDDWLTINVTDTGEGMTDEQQNHMFERFYRGKHTTAGFGLGLYIVKKLLERMGGRITVKSALGKGTAIIVQIPRVV